MLDVGLPENVESPDHVENGRGRAPSHPMRPGTGAARNDDLLSSACGSPKY